MNKTFRSIFNHVTQTFTAVSERQRARGKRARSAVSAAVGAAILAASGASTAAEIGQDPVNVLWAEGGTIRLWASDGVQHPNYLNTAFYLGSTMFELFEDKAGSRWYESLAIENPLSAYTLELTDRGASLDVTRDTSLLLSHSTGFAQQIVSVENGIELGEGVDGSDFNVGIRHADGTQNKTFTQSFVDAENRKIGTATYSVGAAAYESLHSYFGDRLEDVDGFQFDETGVALTEDGIWMLSLLESLNVDAGRELKIDVAADEGGTPSYWFAKTFGEGGLLFEGAGRDESTVVFDFLDQSKDPSTDGTYNYYTGATTLRNVTAVLEKRQAFGRSTDITLENARVQVAALGAWADAGDVKLTAEDFRDETSRVFAPVLTMKNSRIDYTYAYSGGDKEARDQHLYVHGDALFTGDNTLTGSHPEFFFAVYDDLKLDGTLRLVRTDASGTGEETGKEFDRANFKVHGSATLTRGDALQGFKELHLGETLTFDGAGREAEDFDDYERFLITAAGINSNDKENRYTDFQKVTVENASRLEYGDQSIHTLATDVVGGSVLVTSASAYDRQFGRDLTIKESSYVYVNGVNERPDGEKGGLHLEGLALHGDGVFVARGEGADTRLTLAGDMNFSDFEGWIRAENLTFVLTPREADLFTKGKANGVSVGGNGVLRLEPQNNQTIRLEKFGFARYDNDAGVQAGVLDLTAFNFKGSESDEIALNPALSVTDLIVNVAGTVVVDADKIQLPDNTGSVTEGGSVLDYDNADDALGTLLIKAENVDADADNIHLQINNLDDKDDRVNRHDIKNGDSTVADGYWGYDTVLRTEASDGRPAGLYLGYLLTRIDLREGLNEQGETVWAEGDEDRWSGVDLDLGAASDHILSAQITGVGRLNVIAGGEEADNRLILTNVNNTFRGLVDVRENATLVLSAANALGTAAKDAAAGGRGTTLRLQENADFAMAWIDGLASQGDRYTQTLEAIEFLGQDGGNTVTLNGNALTVLDSVRFIEGARLFAADAALDEEDQTQANSDALLRLVEGGTFEDVSTLNGYEGRLALGSSGSGAAEGRVVVRDDDGSTLERLRLEGEGLFDVETNADFAEGGSFTNYRGTLGVGLAAAGAEAKEAPRLTVGGTLGLGATTLAVGAGELHVSDATKAAGLRTGVLSEEGADLSRPENVPVASTLHFAVTDLFDESWKEGLTLSGGAEIADGTELALDLSGVGTGDAPVENLADLATGTILLHDGKAAQVTLITTSDGTIEDDGLVWKDAEGSSRTLKYGVAGTNQSYALAESVIVSDEKTLGLSTRVVRLHAAENETVSFSRTTSDDRETQTLSAWLTGEGTFELKQGTLRVSGGEPGKEENANRYGGFSVASNLAKLVFEKDQIFTGESEWNGAVSAAEDVSLRLEGASIDALRSSVTDFRGIWVLAGEENDASVFAYRWDDAYGTAKENLFAADAAFVAEGSMNRIELQVDGSRTFNTAVLSQDGGSAALRLSGFENGAATDLLTLSDAGGVDRSALTAFEIEAGAALAIKGEGGALDKERWADRIAVSGAGAFELDGVTAESGRFVFDEYVSSGKAASGPLLLRLTNGAQYGFASDALDIDLSLGRDSRLLLANVAGAEGSPSETRVHRFDWAGELCVDLGKANLRNAQLHVDGLHVREGASISLSRDDLESALRAERPALALDDGDALWLVASDTEVTYEKTIGGTADLPDVMITDGSDTAALSGETTVGLAEGVTGTFTTEVVDQIGAKHGLAVENRLVKAAFSEGGRLALKGSGTDSPWDADNSWHDVDILSNVEGAGEMLVSNTVGLFLGEGTNYSGRVDLEKGAALTLSGASFGGATVAFAGDATSSLTLLSDQRLRLEGASGGSMTLGADADGAVTVTLTGASTLGTQGRFTLSGRGEDALVLADGARVTVGGASSALAGYEGFWMLGAGARLVLRDDEGSGATSIDRVYENAALSPLVEADDPSSGVSTEADASGALVLASGRYVLGAGAAWGSRFGGTVSLGIDPDGAASAPSVAGAPELTIEGWEGVFANTLLGSEAATLRLVKNDESKATRLVVESDNAEAFAGTWRVGDESRLVVDGAQIGGTVSLEASGALELQGGAETSAGSWLLFGNAVTTEDEKKAADTAILVTEGYVDARESAELSASEIRIGSGAGLMVSDLERVRTDVVTLDGLFYLNAEGAAGENAPAADDPLVVDGLSLAVSGSTKDGADKDERVFQIAAGEGREVRFGNDFRTNGFVGKVRLVSGTIRHERHGTDENFARLFEVEDNLTLAVSGEAVFEIAGGSETVNLPGGFAWEALDPADAGTPVVGTKPAATAGILDVTGFVPTANGASPQPALTTTSLSLHGGTGLIRLDLDRWKEGIDVPQSVTDTTDGEVYESLLDLDDAGEGKWIVKADRVTGGGTLLLVDENGDALEGVHQEAAVQGGLATGHWNYSAQFVNTEYGASEGGVLLGYALTRLDLRNADAGQDAVRFTAGKNGEFQAWITGEGKIAVEADTVLSHERNTFSGLVTVASGATLASQNHYTLGGSVIEPRAARGNRLVDLVLEEGSRFVLGDEGHAYVERLGVLRADDGSAVDLHGGTLTLAGTRANDAHRNAAPSGEPFSGETGSVFAAGSRLESNEKATLAVEGRAVFADAAETLAGFRGTLRVLSGGVLTLEEDGTRGTPAKAEDPFRLGRLTSVSKDGADRPIVEVGLDTVLGDVSGYAGLYDVAAGKTLTLDADTRWTAAGRPDGPASLLLREGAVFDASAYGSVRATGRAEGPALTTATLEAKTGSTLRLGTVAIGSGFASGAIDVVEKGTFGENVTIEVTVDPNVVLADALLELDTGKTASLVSGVLEELESPVRVDVAVAGDRDGDSFFAEENLHLGALQQTDELGGVETIGSVVYRAEYDYRSDGAGAENGLLGLKFTAESVRLDAGRFWRLDATGMTGGHADETLSLDINAAGEASGGLIVTAAGTNRGTVSLDGNAYLEHLTVGEGAALALKDGRRLVLSSSKTGEETASVVHGQLLFGSSAGTRSDADADQAPDLLVDATELEFRALQEEAAGVVRLENDGALVFSGIRAESNDGAGRGELYGSDRLEVLGGGRVVLENTTGSWTTDIVHAVPDGTQEGGAETGLVMSVLGRSDLFLDVEDFSGLDRLVIGGEARGADVRDGASSGRPRETARVTVASTNGIAIGAQDGVTLEIGENGVYYNEVTVTEESPMLIEGWLGDVEGTGRFVIDASYEDSVDNPGDHFFRLYESGSSDFRGTVAFRNISGVVDGLEESRGAHTNLAGKTTLEAWENATLLVLGDEAEFAGIRLATATSVLDLTKGLGDGADAFRVLDDAVIRTDDGYGKTVNFVQMAEDGVFSFAGGAQVAVTAESVKINAESINRHNTLRDGESLAALLEKNEKDFTHRFFQFLDGRYEGNANDLRVVDENGNDLAEAGDVELNYYDEDGNRLVAFHGGLGVVAGEKEGEDLWVGQTIQGMELFRDAELYADAGDERVIRQWIRSSEDEGVAATGLSVTGGRIVLESSLSSIRGAVTVASGAELRLNADQALGGAGRPDGEGRFHTAKRLVVAGASDAALREESLQGGRVTVAKDKAVDVAALTIAGTLALEENATLRLTGSADSEAEDASQSIVTGAIDLAETAALALGSGVSLAISDEADTSAALGRFVMADDAAILFEVLPDAGASTAETGALRSEAAPEASGDEAPTTAPETGAVTPDKILEASLSGGTFVKKGSGVLGLAAGQFDEEDRVALVVAQGRVDVSGWGSAADGEARAGDEGASSGAARNPLLLQRLAVEKDGAFTFRGDMELSQGEAWRHAGRADLSDGTDKGFVTRVLDGNFAGGETADTAGTIGFRVALGDGEAGEVPTVGIAGDHLEITGDATGSVFFDVVDANGLSKGAGERIVLMTVDGKVDGFAPALANGTIEAGGYSYRLAVDTAAAGSSVTAEGGALAGVSSDDDVTRYFLTSYWGDNVVDGPAVSPNLGSFIAFAEAQEIFDFSIHDHLGTRRYAHPLTGEIGETALWMRQTVSQTKAGASSGQYETKSTVTTTQLGGDILRLSDGGDGLWYAGVMAGFGDRNGKTSSSRTTAKGRADVDGWSAGVYGGWLQNAEGANASEPTGAYAEAWLQWVDLSGDLSSAGASKHVRADGWTASLEVGHGFEAFRFVSDDGTSRGTVYFEPHAQVVWHGLQYDDFDMSGKVRIHGEDNTTVKLGARTMVKFEGSQNATPFLDLAWVHNTERYGATYGAVTDRQEGAKNRLEAAVGIDGRFTKRLSGYASFTLDKGSDGYSRREGAVGLRYVF